MLLQNRHLVWLDVWLWRWFMAPPYTADVTVDDHRAGIWLSPSQAVYMTMEYQAQIECATQWPRHGSVSSSILCIHGLVPLASWHHGPWRSRTKTQEGKPWDSFSRDIKPKSKQHTSVEGGPVSSWKGNLFIIIVETFKLLSLFRSKLETKAL